MVEKKQARTYDEIERDLALAAEEDVEERANHGNEAEEEDEKVDDEEVEEEEEDDEEVYAEHYEEEGTDGEALPDDDQSLIRADEGEPAEAPGEVAVAGRQQERRIEGRAAHRPDQPAAGPQPQRRGAHRRRQGGERDRRHRHPEQLGQHGVE